MFAKIRQQPFSVYLYFLGPDSVKGQEVIYVAGQNDGNMLAHAGSGVRAMVGTVSLKPQSMLAMQGNRYPVTEIGVENLAKRLVEVAEHDKQFGECDVNFYPNAKVNGRVCTCVQVVHPVPRRNFRFHQARVFIDDEYTIPIRYEAYDWPHEEGGQPVLPRGVHLHEREDQQRLHRRRLRPEEHGLQVRREVGNAYTNSIASP